MCERTGMHKSPDYAQMMAVTNRHLCTCDFLQQIKRLAETDVQGIILREKDLKEKEYHKLAAKVLEICERYEKNCILHTYFHTAEDLGCRNIHLPLPVLKAHYDELGDMAFRVIGTSVHSVADAVLAQKLGASYVTAGHVFDTDCKKGLPGRGIVFLSEVCQAVDIPVYAIGGISMTNMPQVMAAGAAGGCMMSGFMRL